MLLRGGGQTKSLSVKAFTLAEVLITIAVVAIIAALTLPGIIGNYKKKVLVAKLKKTVNTLENGFTKMMADDVVFSLEDTKVFSNMVNFRYDLSSFVDSMDPEDKEFEANLKKYFNIISIERGKEMLVKPLCSDAPWNSYDKDLAGVIKFSDGSAIRDAVFFQNKRYELSEDEYNAIRDAGGHLYYYQATFYIDVNADNPPNTFGRDIFEFLLSSDGKLYPEGSRNYNIWSCKGVCSSLPNHYSCLYRKKPFKGISGNDCAGRIIENGWEMDY